MAQQNTPAAGSEKSVVPGMSGSPNGNPIPAVSAQPVTDKVNLPTQVKPAEEVAAASKAAGKAAAPQRSLAQIETDMDATRERLAATIGQLQEALTPKNLAMAQVEKVKNFYVDEYGAVRPERVAATVGVVVGTVVVVRVLKRIF